MSRRPCWWEDQECFPKPGTKLFSVKNALFCLATGPPSRGNIPRIDLQAQYNTRERIWIQLNPQLWQWDESEHDSFELSEKTEMSGKSPTEKHPANYDQTR